MAIAEKLGWIDKRLASSFFVALLIAAISFILGQVCEKHPHLRYEILSQVPVYDVRENLTNLDILFNGQSIQQQHEMLTVISIKVENIGSAGIKEDSYDDAFLPGGRITGSKIIRVDVIAASNNYLTNAVQILRRQENEFILNKVILDRGDFFILKFLVLHSDNMKPELESFGKVADAPNIDINALPIATDKRGFFMKAVSGEIGVQATRIVIYMFGGLVLSVAIIFSLTGITNFFRTKRRKRHIKNYERSLSAKPTKAEKHILNLYERCGEDEIVRLNQLLCNPKELEYSLQKHKLAKDDWNERNVNWHISPPVRVSGLLENNVVSQKNNQISVDPVALETARNFETFLLGVIPKRIMRCRGQKRVESYGTESSLVNDPASSEAMNIPQENV
jgi:hypothetical protein